MDFNLTEEQMMLKRSVRDFLAKECPMKYLQELDEKEEFPHEIRAKIAERGWFSLVVPKEYGGMGGTVLDGALLIEELARGSTPTVIPLFLSSCFGTSHIKEHGNEEQKRLYLPRLASGEITFAMGLTEPDGGTDLLAAKTSAYLDGDSYIINGQKMFTTAAHVADYMNIIAVTNKDATKKTRSLSLFIADTKTPGIEIKKLKTLGWRAIGTNEVFLTDVKVPKKNLLGELNRGWSHLVSTLNTHRIWGGAVGLGIAQAAIDYAVQYAKERQAFGKPIGQFQSIQHYLARATVKTELAKWAVYRAAWLQSSGEECNLDAGVAKLSAIDAAIYATDVGMRIMAGHGYMMEHDMQRYFRDIRIMTSAPITDEMVLNQIGESLGFPRSY